MVQYSVNKSFFMELLTGKGNGSKLLFLIDISVRLEDGN